MNPSRQWSFRRVVIVVGLAHVILIAAISLWNWHPLQKPEEVKFMDVLDARGLMAVNAAHGPMDLPPSVAQGGPAAAGNPAPVQPPAPPPPPPPPAARQQAAEPPSRSEPEAVTPPKPEVPDVEPPPSQIAIADKKPKPPVKHASKPVKVNLDVVSKKGSPGTSSRPTKASSKGKTDSDSEDGVEGSEGKSPSRGTVAARLAGALKGAGLGEAVSVGSPNGSGPGGGGDFSSYYGLIRKQMYDAWDQPSQLAGQGLQTSVQISVEKDGRVSNVTLLRSSGNQTFDASIMAAARRVTRISQPLPAGLDGTISINFKIAE